MAQEWDEEDHSPFNSIKDYHKLRNLRKLHKLWTFNSIKDYHLSSTSTTATLWYFFQFHQGLSKPRMYYLTLPELELSIPSRIILYPAVRTTQNPQHLLSIPSRIIKPKGISPFFLRKKLSIPSRIIIINSCPHYQWFEIDFQFHQGLSKFRICLVTLQL